MFRVCAVGKLEPRTRRLAEVQVEALEAVIDAIRAGAISEKVDKVGRDIIARAGFGKWHVNRLGYSIGVNYPPDWGEGQMISIRKGEKRALQKNMTFHVVSGTIIPEDFGTCTSASVRVTANGCEVMNTILRKVFEK